MVTARVLEMTMVMMTIMMHDDDAADDPDDPDDRDYRGDDGDDEHGDGFFTSHHL